jgi:hypothetical protein
MRINNDRDLTLGDLPMGKKELLRRAKIAPKSSAIKIRFRSFCKNME